MDVVSFARAIREFGPIRRKEMLAKVIKTLAGADTVWENVMAGFGEDSAAINLGGNEWGLLATDGIMSQFVEKNPRGAGYAAILVCLDDIIACGGAPLAASVVINARDEPQLDEILDGLKEGSEKFRIPVVRGHTNTDAPVASLASTIFGTIPKKFFVSAGGAQANNVILVIFDPNGRRSPFNPLIWDTTTMKPSETILQMRKAYINLTTKQLLLSAKDISNAGIFGTLLQMLEMSGCGARINLQQIRVPKWMETVGITPLEMSQMFLVSSFLVCAPAKNIPAIEEILAPVNYSVLRIGETILEKKILLVENDVTEVLFDYTTKNILMPKFGEKKHD